MAVVVVLVRDAAHNKSPVSNPERRGCLMWTTLDHQTCKHPRCEEGAACGGKWKTTLLSHLNKSHLREETEVTDVASWKGHDHTSGVSQTDTNRHFLCVCVQEQWTTAAALSFSEDFSSTDYYVYFAWNGNWDDIRARPVLFCCLFLFLGDHVISKYSQRTTRTTYIPVTSMQVFNGIYKTLKLTVRTFHGTVNRSDI